MVEVLNQGALVFPPGEFGGEFRDSLCLNVFQDVDVFSETLDRLFVPVVHKLALLPAASSFTADAAAEYFQDPCYEVLVVRVVEFTLLNHGVEEVIAS